MTRERTRERLSPATCGTTAARSATLRTKEPGHRVLDELRGGSLAAGDHRRPDGHSLDHHHAERLRPAQWVEQRRRGAKQVELLVGGEFADIFDAAAEFWFDAVRKVFVLLRFPHLRRDEQRHPGHPGDLDRFPHAFARCHPAEEREVAAVSCARGDMGRVDSVVDDACDLHADPRCWPDDGRSQRPRCAHTPIRGVLAVLR